MYAEVPPTDRDERKDVLDIYCFGLETRLTGAILEQIQFLLGYASVQTTEQYSGCKPKFRHAINDNLGP
jgi:hypothetical protein